MSELQSANASLTSQLASALFTMLQIGHRRLLLPQEHVAATATAARLQAGDASPQHTLGFILHAGNSWPVYCLDNQLALTLDPPERRQQCVLLAADQDRIGLLCDQITSIDCGELTIHDIPKCMRTDELLFHGLAVYQDSIAYISSAERLIRFIRANSESNSEQ